MKVLLLNGKKSDKYSLNYFLKIIEEKFKDKNYELDTIADFRKQVRTG